MEDLSEYKVFLTGTVGLKAVLQELTQIKHFTSGRIFQRNDMLCLEVFWHCIPCAISELLIHKNLVLLALFFREYKSLGPC